MNTRHNILSLEFQEPTISLVGNGKTVVQVTPEGFHFLRGGLITAPIKFLFSNTSPSLSEIQSSVRPGCVEFRARIGCHSIRILHGSFADCGYFAAIETDHLAHDRPSLDTPLGAAGLSFRHLTAESHNIYVYYVGSLPEEVSIERLSSLSQERYLSEGLVLQSPSQRLDLAAAFSQQLLDLSYDGQLMVCEIYRWKDVWARDLATGLLPGALFSGRASLARRSLDYDLLRYAANDPRGCKNQDDTSKGGTIDGVAWTLRSLWQFFLHTGDQEQLSQGFAVMEPWIHHWIKREVQGLVSDLTENFDHIYHLLAPDGVRTLGANALFALMLKTSSSICRALGRELEGTTYQERHAQTARAIHQHFWNEELGAYVNLLWWGEQDLRTNQVYHALLALAEAIPEDQAHKAFETLRKQNHTAWGSLTMVPPLTHVEPDNDQNATIWPWWNLWEAQARYQLRDADTAYFLLDQAASTIENSDHPGFLKEIRSAQGESIGGRAFVTGAGNFLDALVRGLLGCEFVSPSCVRIVPQFPPTWENCSARIPTANGWIHLEWVGGQLTLEIRDPKITMVETTDSTEVVGAMRTQLTRCQTVDFDERGDLPRFPKIKKRKAKLFVHPDFPSGSVQPPAGSSINLGEVRSAVADGSSEALVFCGSMLPLKFPDGALVSEHLKGFLDRGGALVFYGATASPRSDLPGKGAMAESCGLIEWHDLLPKKWQVPLTNWEMKQSDFYENNPEAAPRDPMRSKTQFKEGWRPALPLEAAGYCSLSGNWCWYRASFTPPYEFRGAPIWIELGPVEDYEYVFVNGHFAGDYRTQRHTHEHILRSGKHELWDLSRNVPRTHCIQPGSPAYESLQFGLVNTLSLQVYRTYGATGMVAPESATVGIETSERSWQATDPDRPGLSFSHPWRKGAAYWGGEKFFNSWETNLGISVLPVNAEGVEFLPDLSLGGMERWNIPVKEAFTDFAVFKPWRYQALAFTRESRRVLHPLRPEKHPCVARLANEETGGEILLVGQSLALHSGSEEFLERCGILLK